MASAASSRFAFNLALLFLIFFLMLTTADPPPFFGVGVRPPPPPFNGAPPPPPPFLGAPPRRPFVQAPPMPVPAPPLPFHLITENPPVPMNYSPGDHNSGIICTTSDEVGYKKKSNGYVVWVVIGGAISFVVAICTLGEKTYKFCKCIINH